MDAPASQVQSRLSLPLPTTLGGVAALARGSAGRLFTWQLAFALLASGTVVWAAQVTWGRALEHAIQSLPEEAAIERGRLKWTGSEPAVLHRGSFLSIVVEPRGRRETGLSADVNLLLEDGRLAVKSLFGWMEIPLPETLNFSLGRLDVEGAFEAWKVPAWMAMGVVACLGIFLSWIALATVYSLIFWFAARVFGWYLGLARAWRLGAACLLPGALLMTAAIALYATRQLTLIGLLLALPAHLVVGWFYGSGALPRTAARRGTHTNPFEEEPATKPTKSRHQPANPFST